jgi:uncharacterized peroxidase-related enzyme
LRLLTKDPALADQVRADWRAAGLEPRERAMLEFALKLTLESSRMSPADVEPLRAAAWTDEDVMDIAETAAMFNFTNRLANALGWVPNPEYDSLGR